MAEKPETPPESEKESIKDKVSQKLHSIKENENVDTFFTYVKENTLDTVAYLLLIAGLILLFFRPFAGSILLGIVAGYYFSDEIIKRVQNWKKFVDRQGTVRSLIFAGVMLGIFIVIPMIFISAFIVAGLKYLIISEQSK